MLGRRVAATVGLVAALAGCGLAACSDGGSGSSVEASAPAAHNPLLDRTVRNLESARTVRFSVVSRGVPQGPGSTMLLAGDGVLTRPTPTSGAFSGTTQLLINNRKTSLRVISYRDTVYVRQAGAKKYSVIDPVSFGLFDPAGLVKAKTGISSLVTGMKSAQDKGVSEVGGVRLHTVQGEVTGLLARRVVPIADPYQPVGVTLQIDEKTGRPREIDLAGYFFTTTDRSTYQISLSHWNEKVTITAPAT